MTQSTSLSRRVFLLGASGTVAAGSLGVRVQLASAAGAESAQPSASVQGFIVSDAHLGWQDPRQPSPDEQAEMMRRILARFPALDVVIDTGDAHHNYATGEDLGNWTDVIAGECGTLPLYYVAGNHEIAHSNDGDREARSNRLGSVSCRPYYSFDLKGMHFVSLPEMMGANLVTEEALAWAELDLEVNRDKTSILLSHNALTNTTLPHDDRAYRQVANSERVLELMHRFPGAIAWMHGHNHTWEIVERWGKLFVSNGRIGGFPPQEAYGGARLGGIFFEAGTDLLTVRAWSASDQAFFDEISPAYAHLSRTLRVPTSFDPAAPAAVSWGMGGAKDGERAPVFHHHAGFPARCELFLTGTRDGVFSENTEIKSFGERPSGSRMLPALDVAAPKEAWEWTSPGLLLRAWDKDISVCVPRRGEARNAYYRCAPGSACRAFLELRGEEGGQQVQLRWTVHDAEGAVCAEEATPPETLRPGYQTIEARFEMPGLRDRLSIYTSPDSDANYQLGMTAVFSNMTHAVELRRVELALEGDSSATRDPAVTLGEERMAASGVFRPGRIERFAMDIPRAGRSVVRCEAQGNRRVTWLVRQAAPGWQVRNATAWTEDGTLCIGPLRNGFSARSEIVVVPCSAAPHAWVHRLRRIAGARISWTARMLDVEVRELMADTGEIEIVSAALARSVSGALRWEQSDSRVLAVVARPGNVCIEFA